jgi:hypothetical protein
MSNLSSTAIFSMTVRTFGVVDFVGVFGCGAGGQQLFEQLGDVCLHDVQIHDHGRRI